MKTAKPGVSVLEKLNSETNEILINVTFFKDDIAFLKLALDRYFRNMVQIKNLDELRECIIRFQDIKFSYTKLSERLIVHRSALADAIDKGSHKIENSVLNDHLNLCNWMGQFTSDYANIRMEICSIVGDVLKKDILVR